MTDPSPAASKSLLLSRRFAPLFWCQFFSAFSDNFLKNALVFLILFKIGGSAAESLITLAAAVFIAPYFFLSALGGEIADRYDKAVVAQRLKLCRDRRLDHRHHRLRDAFGADAVRGAVRVRRDRLAVRPDQIRHPARPAATNRNCPPPTRWSRARPSWRSCSAPSSAAWRPRTAAIRRSFAGMMLVFALLCWGSSLLIPKVGSGAPDLKISVNIISLHRAAAAASARGPPAVVGRAGDELVLAGRRGGAVAVAAAGEDRARRHRGSRDHVPRGVLGRGCGRLGPRGVALGRPHRHPADPDRRGRARRVRHRSRLGHLRHAAGARSGRRRRGVRVEPRPAGDDRSRRARDFGRPLHRADLRRGAGLGRRRPARPRHRRRQRAQRRLHGRRHHRHRGAAGVPRLDAGAVHPDRARHARRRRR